MRWLALVYILFCGCAARAPSTAGVVDPGSVANVSDAEVSFMVEVYNDAQGTITKDFPLPAPVLIDTVSGTISFHRLNGHCKGKDIATVGFLSNGVDALAIWDFQNEVDAPIYAYFPGGIMASKLHFQSYNDLCLPADFRLALILHRMK